MVSFNPYLRPTAEECLAHPFFKDLTPPHFEGPSPAVINVLELDGENMNGPPSMTILKRLIIDEI
jgi:hypothetical protein